MMINNRIEKVLNNMREEGLDYLLVSNPSSIEYLVDYYVEPYERLFVLVLSLNQKPILFLNKIFNLDHELEVDTIIYDDTDDYLKMLSDVLKKPKKVGIDKDLPSRYLLGLLQLKPQVEYLNGSMCVDKVRMIKDLNEQVLMMEASIINDKAIHQAIGLCSLNNTEKEVATQLLPIYQKLGASDFSFEPIIAYGKNCADGHHVCDESRLSPGDSIIIDIGCKYNGYCSDMTRTVFYKEVSNQAKEIYYIVKKANEAAINMIKPGVKLCDIDKAARNLITDAGYGEYFTHRLGHFIGRETHEYGDVSASFDMAVEEGMVFSIEPGIYIKENLGVRIEDLVLVTEDGCKVLNNYPKDLFVI